MLFKLAALTALIAPVSATWFVQSPWHFHWLDHRDYYSPVLPSTVFDYSLGARHLHSSPFSALSLLQPRQRSLSFFQPRQYSFSRQLDSLADALDDLKPSWKEHDEHVEARLLVRGLRAEDLKAEVSNGVITVTGERACDGACKSVASELSLPFDVTDASMLSLSLAENGVLTVKVPKSARAPAKTKTPLQIVAADPTEKKEQPDALPTPRSPAAVEEETLRALEDKFPQAPAPPSDSPAKETSVDAKEASDKDVAAPAAEPVAEQRSATDTLRKVINTAIGATSMATAGKDAKNTSSEAAAAAETVAAA